MIDLDFVRQQYGAHLDSEGPFKGPLLLLGCDEVGRGPLAGPVCAGAVGVSTANEVEGPSFYLQLQTALEKLQALGVTDSKKLNTHKRQKILLSLGLELSPVITEGTDPLNKNWILNWQNLRWRIAVCSNSHMVIDRINILQAAMKSMDQAISEVCIDMPGQGLGWVDGNRLPRASSESLQLHAQVKGDAKVLLVGLASIVAKEWRDQWMTFWSKEYPEYGLDGHAGYPTAKHLQAIETYGPSPIHRLSFKGVKGVPFKKYTCSDVAVTGNALSLAN